MNVLFNSSNSKATKEGEEEGETGEFTPEFGELLLLLFSFSECFVTRTNTFTLSNAFTF